MDDKPGTAKGEKAQKARALQVEHVNNGRDQQVLNRKPSEARQGT